MTNCLIRKKKTNSFVAGMSTATILLFLLGIFTLSGCGNDPGDYDEEGFSYIKEYTDIMIPFVEMLMFDMIDLAEAPDDEKLATVGERADMLYELEKQMYFSDDFPNIDEMQDWQINMTDDDNNKWVINGAELHQYLQDYSDGFNLFYSTLKKLEKVDDADEDWIKALFDAMDIFYDADVNLRNLMYNM